MTPQERKVMELALEALKHLQPTALTSFYTIGDRDKAITAIKEALAQPTTAEYAMGYAEGFNDGCKPKPEQEPVAWKLVPREATREMLEAMDECSIEGYDEHLYAGHAASVYMAAVDVAPTPPQQKQEPVALEAVYETIIHWDEGGGKRSRRELARRIVDLYTTPPQRTWVDLTDEEEILLIENDSIGRGELINIVKNKLKEKNT